MTQRKVRVRFAPSPTGALHIGGVRTALYNYLFAKQNGGDLILRIEDTDSQRFVPGAEAYIIEALTWLGIKFDEGVGFGGEYGPYRQSERRDIYKKYVDQLLDAGCAYIAFDTPKTLDAKRKEIPNFQYDASTRMQMRNSLTLSEEEVKSLIDAGNQYVVRVKIEPDEDIHVNDLIRGEVIINSSILDDKVLYKSADQLPTYHLANIVDDHLMEVTHVIRGEEWLPSAPLHVLLYRYFGWEDTMPRFAHLALLLKPEGNGKLSKRDGDRLGFPVFPLEWHDPKSGEVSSGYRESGYLPEAVVNFLALLGWNPGNDQEVMSMDELIHSFDLSRCSKSGAKYDTGKTALEVNMMNFKNLHQNDAGKAITVEYSATLNKDAEVGSTGNQNDAKIEYSNDPASNGTGTTKEDKTYTYTFNFDIEKVNAVDHNDKLKGAQFELQRENGTKINLVKVSDGVFRPAKGTETVADDKTVVTDNNGKLQFTGLKEGTYKVKEIKAPTGYNLLKDPITVTISATYDENTGILESWKVNNANAQGTTVPVITVENNKGVTLPETGGMGTVLFTVFGVAIVALGATWYVKSNRKSRHAA